MPQGPDYDEGECQIEGSLVTDLEVALTKGNVQHAVDLAQKLAELQAKLSITLHAIPPSLSPQQIRLEVVLECASQTFFAPIPLQVSSSITVFGLKVKMVLLYGIPRQCQRWIIGKKIPRDGESLKKLGITKAAKVFLYLLDAKTLALDRGEVSQEEENLRRFHEEVLRQDGNPDLALTEQEYERYLQSTHHLTTPVRRMGGAPQRVHSWSGGFSEVDEGMGDQSVPPPPLRTPPPRTRPPKMMPSPPPLMIRTSQTLGPPSPPLSSEEEVDIIDAEHFELPPPPQMQKDGMIRMNSLPLPKARERPQPAPRAPSQHWKKAKDVGGINLFGGTPTIGKVKPVPSPQQPKEVKGFRYFNPFELQRAAPKEDQPPAQPKVKPQVELPLAKAWPPPVLPKAKPSLMQPKENHPPILPKAIGGINFFGVTPRVDGVKPVPFPLQPKEVKGFRYINPFELQRAVQKEPAQPKVVLAPAKPRVERPLAKEKPPPVLPKAKPPLLPKAKPPLMKAKVKRMPPPPPEWLREGNNEVVKPLHLPKTKAEKRRDDLLRALGLPQAEPEIEPDPPQMMADDEFQEEDIGIRYQLLGEDPFDNLDSLELVTQEDSQVLGTPVDYGVTDLYSLSFYDEGVAPDWKTTKQEYIELLQAEGYDLESCEEAIRESGVDLERARNYFKECELCMTKFPMSKIVGNPYCQCHVCVECFTQHYTVLAQSTPCMYRYVCPACQEPDLKTFQDDGFQSYFGLLGTILQQYLEGPDYDLYNSKLVTWGLMKDENFRWCVNGCGNGFINEQQDMKLQCPGCKKYQCFECKKVWLDQHDDISCEEFDAWKRNNDPEFQKQGLAAHLKENGINCPKCKMRYELAKGGCMHFKCPQCQHEFCCGCNLPFMKYPDCKKSQSCARKGLHAHHPRDCLYHLRDEDTQLLQQLLQNHGIDFMPPNAAGNRLRAATCPVNLQLEANGGLVDNNCGKPLKGQTGLCELHYKEYLVSLINQHKVDPLDIFSIEQLGHLLTRHDKRVPPKRRMEANVAYKNRLRQTVKELLPLNQ